MSLFLGLGETRPRVFHLQGEPSPLRPYTAHPSFSCVPEKRPREGLPEREGELNRQHESQTQPASLLHTPTSHSPGQPVRPALFRGTPPVGEVHTQPPHPGRPQEEPRNQERAWPGSCEGGSAAHFLHA